MPTNDLLLGTSGTKVSRSIELEPDGSMTVVISMASKVSSSSVRTTSVWTYRAGWRNSLSKWLMRKAIWVLLSTKSEEQTILRNSMPPSPSDYSLTYSEGRDTNDESRNVA